MLLIKKGYKLEKGEKADAISSKGSKIGRAFLGAFINRFAFSVKITYNGVITSLAFAKHGKVYVLGAIGLT